MRGDDRQREPRPRRLSGGAAPVRLLGCLAALGIALLGLAAAPAQAATGDPLYVFTPQPPPPPGSPVPPPSGYLNGPCGLAVDSVGNFYVADQYHGTVDVFSSSHSYLVQLSGLGDPCGLGLDPSNHLYVGGYHGAVKKFGAYPSFGSGAAIDSGHSTGVATDTAGNVYVDERDRIVEYDSGGAEIAQIGLGDLGEGYGVAVSGYSGTEGRIYVPDAASNTVKVFSASGTLVDEIKDPYGHPFVSLRDAAIAVDDSTGRVYFADDTQPTDTEQPLAKIYIYSPADAWLGFLRYAVVDALPPGLAVDNSEASTQGRVYVTSGNSNGAGVYAYPPGVAPVAAPLAPTTPGALPGGGPLDPTIPIGGATIGATGTQIACEGDACQVLPPEPVDPTLTTLLSGHGNPRPHYPGTVSRCVRLGRAARKLRRNAHRLARRAKRGSPAKARGLLARAARLRKRAQRRARAAKRCARAERKGKRGGARASASSVSGGTAAIPSPAGQSVGRGATGEASTAGTGSAGPTVASSGATVAGLLGGSAGFGVAVSAGGGAGTLAGSHPYAARFNVGLDQGGGASDLRSLRIATPPGLLADPPALGFCTGTQFSTHRSSPYEPSQSGESCPERSQAGTVAVSTALHGGETRRFGLFELSPPDGSALELAASPYGMPLRFEGTIESDSSGTYLVLTAAEIPQALQAHGLELTLWGTPWDASHNAERGSCLNEAEPGFPWCKSSVGEPLAYPPRAFLTLPTECASIFAFAAASVLLAGRRRSEGSAQPRRRRPPGGAHGLRLARLLPPRRGPALGQEGLLGRAASSSG